MIRQSDNGEVLPIISFDGKEIRRKSYKDRVAADLEAAHEHIAQLTVELFTWKSFRNR